MKTLGERVAALSESHQSLALQAILRENAVLLTLTPRLLAPGAGKADDALCRWLFDLSRAVSTVSAGQASLSAAHRFVLSFVPVMAYSLLTNAGNAQNSPGLSEIHSIVF